MNLDNVDFIPPGPEDGPPQETPFFLMRDRSEADHTLTLRMHKSMPPLKISLGYEIARFNPYALAILQHGDLLPRKIVDLLNQALKEEANDNT